MDPSTTLHRLRTLMGAMKGFLTSKGGRCVLREFSLAGSPV